MYISNLHDCCKGQRQHLGYPTLTHGHVQWSLVSYITTASTSGAVVAAVGGCAACRGLRKDSVLLLELRILVPHSSPTSLNTLPAAAHRVPLTRDEQQCHRYTSYCRAHAANRIYRTHRGYCFHCSGRKHLAVWSSC